MANPATGKAKKYNDASIDTGTFDLNIAPGNAFATDHKYSPMVWMSTSLAQYTQGYFSEWNLSVIDR